MLIALMVTSVSALLPQSSFPEAVLIKAFSVRLSEVHTGKLMTTTIIIYFIDPSRRKNFFVQPDTLKHNQKCIIIIMYIYHALINALSAHMTHINLNMIFYTHVKHSPTKTVYIKYYLKK